MSEERRRGHGPEPDEPTEVPGAHLEVDIVPEGVDPLGRGEEADPYAAYIAAEPEEEQAGEQEPEEAAAAGDLEQAPVVQAAIDLGASARYQATGKRKNAVARVIMRPGKGAHTINGRSLEEYFPRVDLQRMIAALLEADPNLRRELKRRGLLTRDSRVKERKKAGLKKARKRPQFSKR